MLNKAHATDRGPDLSEAMLAGIRPSNVGCFGQRRSYASRYLANKLVLALLPNWYSLAGRGQSIVASLFVTSVATKLETTNIKSEQKK